MLNRFNVTQSTKSNRIARLSPLLLLLLLFPAFSSPCTAKPPTQPSSDETQIRATLEDQTAAWNRGDIDGLMAGYWKSDETEFVSAEGVSRGWQALLERYKHSYPDRKAMGTL